MSVTKGVVFMMEFYHLFILCLLPIVTPLVGALIGIFIGLVIWSVKYLDEDKKKGRH